MISHPFGHGRCTFLLHSLEGDGVLAVVRLAVPDQEASLFAGLQPTLGLLASHTAVVPAETDGDRVAFNSILILKCSKSFYTKCLKRKLHVTNIVY